MSFIKDFSSFFHTRSDSNTAEIHAHLSGLMQVKRSAKNLERMEEDVPDFNYQAVHITTSTRIRTFELLLTGWTGVLIVNTRGSS